MNTARNAAAAADSHPGAPAPALRDRHAPAVPAVRALPVQPDIARHPDPETPE